MNRRRLGRRRRRRVVVAGIVVSLPTAHCSPIHTDLTESHLTEKLLHLPTVSQNILAQ